MKNLDNQLKNILKSNKVLILILTLSFLASLFYSFHFQIKPKVDARAYDLIALNLIEGRGYRESLEGPIERDYAITRIGPLYQFTLAGIYFVFGHRYEPVWVMQAILHAISAWLIYLICLLIFPPKAGLLPRRIRLGRKPWVDRDMEYKKKMGLVAAGIFGFYPDLIEISAMLLIETFYLFLFILALYVFFKYFNKHNVCSAVLLGFTFGLATLARPPVLFLIPVVLYYFYHKKKLMLSMVFIAIMLMVFTPWTIRNYSMYDKFAPLGVGGAFNFWIGNYHGANGEQEPPPEAWEYAETYGIIEVQEEAIRQFKNFLAEYPGEFVKLTMLRINKYFSIIRPMGFWFYQSGWSQFAFLCSSGIASIILFVFGLGGFIRAFALKNEQLNYLISFTIITPLIIFITVVETRYRFQIYPLLAIFAGYFIIYLTYKKKFWLNETLWTSMVIVFGNGLIDLMLSFERFKERLGWFF